MKAISNLSTKERREYFGYLLIIFLAVAGLLGWLLFYKVSNPFRMLTDAEKEILRQKSFFEQKQEAAVAKYDSIMQKIEAFRSTPGSAVAKSDIENEIRVLESYYDQLPNRDIRSISFEQMASFLQRYYEDVMVLQKSLGNAQVFQTELNECQAGLDKKSDNLNQIRAAQRVGQ